MLQIQQQNKNVFYLTYNYQNLIISFQPKIVKLTSSKSRVSYFGLIIGCDELQMISSFISFRQIVPLVEEQFADWTVSSFDILNYNFESLSFQANLSYHT